MTAVAAATPAAARSLRPALGGLGAVLALAVIGAALLLVAVPLVTGGSARTVRTGSMSPALPVGSVVFDRPVARSSLRVGDIATYREPDGHLVTHRIVAVRGTTFTFRGDANAVADPAPVAGNQIVGRVWLHVPLLGTVQARLAALRPQLMWLAALVLGAFSIVSVRAGLRERRAG